MKGEILKMKADLAATNSQDEFAKWAKLRRKLDKGVLEYETLSQFSPLAQEILLKLILEKSRFFYCW